MLQFSNMCSVFEQITEKHWKLVLLSAERSDYSLFRKKKVVNMDLLLQLIFLFRYFIVNEKFHDVFNKTAFERQIVFSNANAMYKKCYLWRGKS